MSYRVCGMEVYAGPSGSSPTQLVGFTSGATVAEEAEERDVSVTGNCVKSYLAGALEVAITLDGYSRHLPGTDPTQDAGQALIAPQAIIALAIRPNGTGSGKPQVEWTDVIILSRTFAGVVDGAWTWNITARANVPTDDAAQV